MNLLDTALLRAAASKAGIRDISQKNSQIHFTLGLLNFEAVSAVCADPYNRGRVYLAAGNTPVLMLKLKPTRSPSRRRGSLSTNLEKLSKTTRILTKMKRDSCRIVIAFPKRFPL